MKKIIFVFLILILTVGCIYKGNMDIDHGENVSDNMENEKIIKLRHLFFDNMSPFRFAVIKEIILESTMDLKKYYKYEYNGGEIETVYLGHEIKRIGQLTECVDNEKVKEDLFRAYALLDYADKNDSQSAFDTAYEILETLNAYLFNYPFTQSIFSDREIQINAMDMNIFYPCTLSFGHDITDEMAHIVKNTKMPKDHMLKDNIENRENDINKQIAAVKNHDEKLFEYMYSVRSAAEKLKFATDNYDQYDIEGYCKNVKNAMEKLYSENDRLLISIKDSSIKHEYMQISEAINSFENKFKDGYTQIDILSDVNEIYYKAIKLEYLYCHTNNNKWLDENITINGIASELESK